MVRLTRRELCLVAPASLVVGAAGQADAQRSEPRIAAAGAGRIIDKFSHGIIVVRDLESAIVAFETMGFTVERGARYSNGGSGVNAYVRFGRAFLELLAMSDRSAPPAPNTVGRAFQDLVRGGASGLVAFGLGAIDANAARARFDRVGLPHYRIDQSMRHADGTLYGWTVLIVRDHPWQRPWPVVSRYDEAEEARMTALVPDHGNGARRILAATIRVPTIEAATELFGDQLALPLRDEGGEALLLDGTRLRFVPGAGVPGIHDLTIGVANLDATRAGLAARGVMLPGGDTIALPAEMLAGVRLNFIQL